MMLSNNINTKSVAKEIGSNSRDIGNLCMDENINMWSRWKPTRSTCDYLDENELSIANFSLELYEKQYPIDCIAEVQKHSVWTYNRPQNLYRLGDFRNYNHNAFCFTSSPALRADVAKGGLLTVVQELNIMAEILPKDFDMIKSDFPENWHYALLVRRLSNKNTQMVLGPQVIIEGEEKEMISFQAVLPDFGTYEGCIVICNTSTSITPETPSKSFFMPFSGFQVEYRPAEVPVFITSDQTPTNPNPITNLIKDDMDNVTGFDFSFYARNNTDKAQNVRLRFGIYEFDRLSEEKTFNVSLTPNGENRFVMSFKLNYAVNYWDMFVGANYFVDGKTYWVNLRGGTPMTQESKYNFSELYESF